MKDIKKKGEAAATASTLKTARLFNRAKDHYPQSLLGSNELAARVIGKRFQLSPAVACTVVELAGYGRRA